MLKKSINRVLLSLILLFSAQVGAYGAEGVPSGKPGPVSNLTTNVHAGSDINWDVNWGEPTNTGGSPITGYTVTILRSSDSSTVLSCTTDSLGRSCLITGLAYKTSYVARVYATNINGNGTPTDSAPFTTSYQTQEWTTQPVNTSKSYGSADFQLIAVASSGLPVSWVSSNTAACTVDSSGVVHLVSSAGCTITYTQNGVGSPFNAITGSIDITVTANTSTSISPVTDVQSTTATLNGQFIYGGQNITPQFCVSASNSISTTCTSVGTISTYSQTNITNTSPTSVTATVSGLTAGTTYYVWSIASPAGGSAVASPTSTSFTTTTGPSINVSGTPSASVGQTITLTFTASGGSGIYPVWDHGTLPDGFTFTPGVTEAVITGSGTTISTTPTWVSVSDSNLLTATKSITIEITSSTPAGGGGGGTSGGGNGGTSGGSSNLKNQIITTSNIPNPASFASSGISLNGTASSGLPVSYSSNSPEICVVDSAGQVTYLKPGKCLISIYQGGNSEYAPAVTTIEINVIIKLDITLEEFSNLQSTSVTAIATAPYPGEVGKITFCISTSPAKTNCMPPGQVIIGEVHPGELNSNSGSTFTSLLSGLHPNTNYYVWAVEKTANGTATSEIRKIHTPNGPTIAFTGITNYKVNQNLVLLYKASGGSGGYKNWNVNGLPNSFSSSGANANFSSSGYFSTPGLYQLTISVSDRTGNSTSINIDITVTDDDSGINTLLTSVIAQPNSSNSTLIKWNPVTGATAYFVNIGSIKKCEVSSTSCVIPYLVGPKSKISVAAIFKNGTNSIASAAIYKAPIKPIQIEVANFDLNSSVLKTADKIKIQKLAKVFIAQGFTSIQVSGYTDSLGNTAINTPLSRARATATFNYLQNILINTPLSATLVANGARNPVASNATKEGQAKNRRAVLYLK